MTDFTAKAPFNPEKSHELHARASLPEAPARDMARHFVGIWLGIVGTCIFVALAFQARAGWENHREWVVAMTLPGAAIAGVCFGYLLMRREIIVALPGLVLLILSACFAGLNYSRGLNVDGPDVLRDVLTTASGVLLVASGHAFLIGEIWVEWKHPTRAPKPEM